MDKRIRADILTETGILNSGTLVIEDGVIAAIEPEGTGAGGRVFDGGGGILVPGFIDLHVHGGAGCDFMDGSPEAVDTICRFHARHGTTGLLATTMTAPLERIEQLVRFFSTPPASTGAAVLGVHLEGPFINPAHKGAQNEEWIQRASVESVKRLLAAAGEGLIKMITLAPELVGDDEVFALLKERGIVIAAGHTDLDYRGGCTCLGKGVSHLTHLGNAMRGLHHRDIGAIGLALENPELSFDLIVDGIHLSADFIRLLVRICSLDQISLITDAMRAAGLVDGEYELGGQTVRVTGMEARLPGGVLAGSMLTLDRALANLIAFTGLPLEQAVPLVTLNPARKLGLDRQKGSIAIGKDADLVLLGGDLTVRATWVGGRLVFREGNGAA
jgi:N-acetylglucosamine-6-phosphate deacetylase